MTVVCYPGDDLGLHLSYDQRLLRGADRRAPARRVQAPATGPGRWFPRRTGGLPLLGEDERDFLLGRLQPQRPRLPAGARLDVRLRSRRRWRLHPGWHAASCLGTALELRRAEPPGQPPRPRPCAPPASASTSRWHCWPRRGPRPARHDRRQLQGRCRLPAAWTPAIRPSA
ncbi:hypothetical protein ACPA9J_19025 [Pseudomonas aeruginosa]